MAGDTKVSWEGIGTDVCSAVKLFATNGCLYGLRGADCTGQLHALEWLRGGAIPANRPAPPANADWDILELSVNGIANYNEHLEREELLDQLMAIGTGRKVALYCMRYLGMSPAEAVAEACKVDDFSGPPIYTASLKSPFVRRWSPSRKKGR